ncbi:MAG: hypothetical protein ACR2KK_11700 [Acidimicrobiales bacterium]
MAIATLLAGAGLVCSPAVLTSAGAQLDLVTAPASAVPAVPPVIDGPAPKVATVPAPPPFELPTRPEQWFNPSGKNQGTEGVAEFLGGLALYQNAPLYLSERSGRTTGGTNSDHHASRTDSWAIDVAVRGIQQPTPATHTAAKRISTALGEPNWSGGDLTKTINGYRIQVLWLVPGHFNHVHVGVRKV